MKYSCFECGSVDSIEHHHVVPRVLGGTKTVPLCVTCHGLVHDRDFVKSRRLQRIGIEKAKQKGVYKMSGNGRKHGEKESIQKFMSKPKNNDIAFLLRRGYSIRKVAELALSSTCTVQKVKRIMYENTNDKTNIKRC